MASATAWTTRISLEPQAVSVSRARQFVTEQLCAHQLLDLVEDVALVASELSTNALRYSRSQFTVELEGSPYGVRLVVSDDSALNPVRCHPGVWDTGGRGLGIVDSVSGAWGVVDGTTATKSVWASFAVLS